MTLVEHLLQLGAERCEVIGRATLVLGNCRTLLPALDHGRAIVTDPPYGVGYVHGGYGQGVHNRVVQARRDGRVMERGTARNANRPIAGDDGPFDPSHLLYPKRPTLMWGANHYADRLPAKSGSGWLVWNKNPGGRGPADNFTDAELAWANFPIKRNVIEYLWKGVACEKAGEENGARYHPTTKPQGLMLRCLQLLPNFEELRSPDAPPVLDPYMGSGSTGVACAKLGLAFVGIEIDPDHFDVACERLDRAQRQGNLLDPPPTVREPCVAPPPA